MKKTFQLFMCVILAITMVCCSCVTAWATSKTAAEAVAWAKSKVGITIDYDGAYGGQCVDLIFYYYVYLGESSRGGNASDYTWNSLPSGWQRLTVTSGFVPQAGDIAVWKTNHSCDSCITGPNGHVGIVTAGDSTGFMAVNQAPSSGSGCMHTWFYNSALQCVIRPNFSNGSSTGLSVTKTENCRWRVTIPANYRLDLYEGAANASPSTKYCILPKDSSYGLTCDKKITLSNGTTRYGYESPEGFYFYFQYNSSKMSVEERHNYQLTSTQEASCTKNGYKQYTCSRCSDSYKTTISSDGSSHSYVKKKVEATCTQAGYTLYTCSECGDGYQLNDNNDKPLGHAYASEVVQPTFTDRGYTLNTCSRCGYWYKDNYTPALSQNGGDSVERYYGEVNVDGKSDAKDALMVLQYAVQKRSFTVAEMLRADVNGDGFVNAKDALLILQYTVGKITKFPVE